MFCKHCGKDLPEGSTVCTSCGCYAGECTVRFIRKSQYVGCLVPIIIEISGKDTALNVEVKSGQSLSVSLPSGNYRFHTYCGLNFGKTYEIVLTENKAIHLSINGFTGSVKIREE